MQERTPTLPWSWEDLSLFLAVARHGNLSAAARALGVNPSTTSRRLAALEEALGARLFDRTPDGLALTPLATQVRPLAEEAEAAMLGFSHAVAGLDVGLHGTVRLAVPDGVDSLLLAPMLPAFYALHPDISLEIAASSSLANLSRREADLALRFVRPTSNELIYRRALTLPSKVWGTDASIAALPRRWVVWDEGLSSPAEAAWEARNLKEGRVALRVNRLEAFVAAVRAGVGVGVFSASVGGLYPELVLVPGLEPPPPSDMFLVAHRSLYAVPRVRAVWQFLADLCARLSGSEKSQNFSGQREGYRL